MANQRITTKGETTMKKLLLALFVLAGITTAHAQLSANLTATSDYRFRGISQTQNGAAVQGGIDYAHESGFYIGNWNSTVSKQLYPNGMGVETDLYAGFKKDIYNGITIDVGSYNYFYPNSQAAAGAPSFTTNEAYAGLGYGPVTAKYSYSIGTYFGIANSTGSGYAQVDLAQPVIFVENLNVVAHFGNTNVAKNSSLNYNDINVGLVYNLPYGLDLGARYYTNTNQGSNFQSFNTVQGKTLYKDAWVVNLTKTFN
jgi:uncharacterized protein (TIGR02001 family)